MANHSISAPPKLGIFFLIVRILQALLGLTVLGLAANFIHGASTEEQVLALVCGLFTIGLVAFSILTSRLSSLQNKTIIYIITMGADAFLALLWLSSMGSNIRLRLLLTRPVSCAATVNTGDAINSNFCITKRTNPYLVVGPFGRITIDIVSGFSALEVILFLVTLILTILHVNRLRRANHNGGINPTYSKAAQDVDGMGVGVVQPMYQTNQAYAAPSHAPSSQPQYSNTYAQATVHQPYQVSPVSSTVAPAGSPPVGHGYGAPPPQQYGSRYSHGY